MFSAMNPQVIAALMKLTRLKQDEGLLLALHPDFILVVRPGMDEDEREDAADALLSAAEGLSLPVMEYTEDENEDEDNSVVIPADVLERAGFLGLDYLDYTVENGRIIIEREDY